MQYEWLPSGSSPSGWQDIGFETADVRSDPIQWVQDADVVIVDPPRKGLGPELLAALCEPESSSTQLQEQPRRRVPDPQEDAMPHDGEKVVPSRDIQAGVSVGRGQQRPAQRLSYLSCGLPALIRDLQVLVQSGHWQVVHAQGWLFFPGTDSIETLVILERK